MLGRPATTELDELREASLVRQSGGGRFELLELVRAFALEALASTAESASVHARHRRYFAEVVRPVGAQLLSRVAFGDAAEPLVADHANLRAAFDDAVREGDQESAHLLALGMQALWLAGNLRRECEEVVGRLLDRFSFAAEDELRMLRGVAALEVGGGPWQRRFADRAAELGNAESLAIATVQMHAEAVGTDPAEIERLHPILLGLLESEASTEVLGWVHFALSGDAFVEGDYAEALRHVEATAAAGEELSYEYMRMVSSEMRLLTRSALERQMSRNDVEEVVELGRRHGIHTVAVAALLFVARYAAGIGDESSGRWLALAERTVIEWDTGRSLEDVLREETMHVLGITDLEPLIAQTPSLDPSSALAEAAEWLATRPADEISPRDYIAPVRFAEASAEEE